MPDKAIFFDRDDTLIEDPGYINHPDQVKLIAGVPEALLALKELGYKLIVVSNQSGVARGMVTEEVLGQIHDRLKELLAAKGAFLDQIYFCPYHPDGAIEKYRKDSDRRKPSPGMLLTAADEMDIELSQSWMIGNSDRDIIAGSRAGCKTILIYPSSQRKAIRHLKIRPDHEVVNMREAVNIIKKHLRSGNEKNDQQPPPTVANESPTQSRELIEKPVETDTQQVDSQPRELVENSQQLLSEILKQLKHMQRDQLYGEFSALRLMAGVFQIIAAACLIVSVSFLLRPNQTDSLVFTTLAFGILIQMMALTFYLIDRRR
jgi:D-glycero-D-manno-heptose 1,7-bisphosphate phosphatase